MKQTTIDLIQTLLEMDSTVKREQIEGILRLCRQTTIRRHLLTAKEAMEILQISRPTLRSYVKNGYLAQINFSTRKVRFDETEVRSLACNGFLTATGTEAI